MLMINNYLSFLSKKIDYFIYWHNLTCIDIYYKLVNYKFN